MTRPMEETIFNMGTAEHWNGHAVDYEKLVGNRGGIGLDVTLQLLGSRRPLSTATAVLDDGCGTGNAIAAVIDRYGDSLPASTRLIATDFSKAMVASVERRKSTGDNAANPLWQRIETHVLDAEDLSPGIAPGSISHIISNLVFSCCDFRKAVKSAYDALEVGGVLAFSMPTQADWFEIAEYAKAELDPEGEWKLRAPEELRDEESVRQILIEVGFSDIEMRRETARLKSNAQRLRFMVTMYTQGTMPVARVMFDKYPKDQVDRAVDIIVESTVRDRGPEFELSAIYQYALVTK
jgi:SAM-dependent methyltransferase